MGPRGRGASRRRPQRSAGGADENDARDANAAEDELYAVRAGDKAARDLFAYSIAHLTLLFAALLVEHGAGAYKPVLSLLGGVA